LVADGAKVRPGLRPDNLWMQYNSQMTDKELAEYWDRPFTVKPGAGYYAWSKPKVKVHVTGLKYFFLSVFKFFFQGVMTSFLVLIYLHIGLLFNLIFTLKIYKKVISQSFSIFLFFSQTKHLSKSPNTFAAYLLHSSRIPRSLINTSNSTGKKKTTFFDP